MATETTSRGQRLANHYRDLPVDGGSVKRTVLNLFRPTLDWISFGLMLGAMVSVVWSVQAANWAATPPLYVVLLIGFLVGVILAKLRSHWIVVQAIALVAWSATFVLIFLRFLDTPLGFGGVEVIVERFGEWVHAARTGGISTDDLPFAVALVTLSWLMGYLAGWQTSRTGSVWVPLVVAGIGLLINLSYLPPEAISHFYLYLAFAMLAVAWAHYLVRRRRWETQRIQRSSLSGAYALNYAFWFGLIVILVAIALPSLPQPSAFDKVYQLLRWPVETFSGDFNRLFAGVPARKPPDIRAFDNVLAFQGKLVLGEQVVFTAQSTGPIYWKVRSYPSYISNGWTSGFTQSVVADWSKRDTAQERYESRQEVLQEVTLQFNPHELPTGGHISQSDVKLSMEIPLPPEYTVTLGSESTLPPDLESFVQTLKRMTRLPLMIEAANPLLLNQDKALEVVGSQEVSDNLLRSLLPDEFTLTDVSRGDAGELIDVKVRRVVPPSLDVLSAKSPRRLLTGETYIIKSSVSVATPNELRSAGENYPGWVRDIYLQLPDSLPTRVKNLAFDLTRNEETPYDKAINIQDYLKEIPYSLDIPAPGYNVDGVDHFLFDAQSGYSEYYGSAMAVLLRAVGVPARLAMGYSYGDEGANGIVLVRDKHAHGWTEIFFPEYGWVDFEPTPGRSLPIEEAAASVPFLSDDSTSDEDPEAFDMQGDEDLLAGIGLGTTSDNEGRFKFGLPSWTVLLATFSIALAALMIWRLYKWLLSVPRGAVEAYDKMVQLSYLGGIGPRVGQTPLEYRNALSERFPRLVLAFGSVVDTYSDNLYGHRTSGQVTESGIPEAWRELRFVLVKQVFRRIGLPFKKDN